MFFVLLCFVLFCFVFCFLFSVSYFSLSFDLKQSVSIYDAMKNACYGDMFSTLCGICIEGCEYS